MRSYLDDTALRNLKRAGFSFIRIPVQPQLAMETAALASAIERAQRQGLAVVVVLFPTDWHLEQEEDDRRKIIATWHTLASAMRRSDPANTFAEVLNEPVFAEQPSAWARLQHEALTEIRALLPTHTVVLTGADWGSVAGLLSLSPESDPNVVYSVHIYEPAELTALGAYRPGLDQAAMARLPFPADDRTDCARAAAGTHDAATADLIRFYCAQGWNAERITSRIGEAAAWAKRNQASVMVGEFGASDRLNVAARLSWLTTVRRACEERGVGWALWGYDDSMGFALHPPGDTRVLDSGVLNSLGLRGR